MRLNLGRTEIGSQDVKSGTTLVVSHPACLEHDMGEGHPERPDRVRAIERALESETFQMLARDVAPRADDASIARVHPHEYIEAIREADAETRPDRARSGHVHVAGLVRGRASRRRRRDLRRRRGDGRQGPQRLRLDPAARPSRRSRDPDGLLLFQQRRDRRPARAKSAWRRARRDHGFRRPSRQRHPAHFLGRSDRALRLDPPDAALSRHRRASRSAASTTRSSTRPYAPATEATLFGRPWRARSCRASRRSRRIS